MNKMKKITILLLTLSCFSFISCNKDSESDIDQLNEIDKKLSSLKSKELVTANNEFAFDFFRKYMQVRLRTTS